MGLIKTLKSLDYSALALALCLFAGLRPYFLWNAPGIIDITIKGITILLVWYHTNFKNRHAPLLFVFFSILLLLQGFIRGYDIITWLVTIIPISLLPLINVSSANNCFTYFVVIFAGILLGSILVWTLVLVGFSLPFEVIDPLNSIKDYNYIKYPLLLVPTKTNIMQDIRFGGPFDEPGVVGTICLICLFINKYNLRKWYNIVLLIAGVCSFSLMFVIGTLIYVCSLLFNRKPWAIIIVAIIIAVFYGMTNENEVFDELLYSRLEWNSSSGSFSGDNRSKNGEAEYLNQIRGTSDYYWGGPPNINQRFAGSWGIRNVVIIYGFIFVALYCIFFFAFALSRRLSFKSLSLFGLIFLAVIYQRPDLFETTKVFLFTYLILRLKQDEIDEIRIRERHQTSYKLA